MFIMRPEAGLLEQRSLQRVIATFAGVSLGALLVQRGVGEVILVGIGVATVAAALGTRSSRWYVTAAGTGLVVLLMSGVSSTDAFALTFDERLLETAVGAGLALVFGGVAGALARRTLHGT